MAVGETPASRFPASRIGVLGEYQSSFAMHSGAAYVDSARARGQKDSKIFGKNMARITAPTTGTITALDPDIPPRNQRVSFQAQGSNLHWLLDGKAFAKGTSAQWLPWPGRHVLQITNAKGQVLDEVRLEVRGAGFKGGPLVPIKPR
ncbi:MAG: hypothetical protein IPI09_07745 [Burkholderiales bacterium]|nr:hypothetical protein [Burkholderiales bacterium]MBK7280617.1 hypothetical protein [Burkholderiales bacterium]MBK7314786.1 hypothetical protein [Burkholderiales bacterium]MBL0244107.1 hypothetical protein [Rhodoferax sp.]